MLAAIKIEMTVFECSVWCRKTRMVWLPDGEKNSKICLFVLTWSTNVTDGRTDGQTPHADIYRAYAYASRGKNNHFEIYLWHYENLRYRNFVNNSNINTSMLLCIQLQLKYFLQQHKNVKNIFKSWKKTSKHVHCPVTNYTTRHGICTTQSRRALPLGVK